MWKWLLAASAIGFGQIAETLAPGKQVESEIQAGANHAYTFHAEKGQFVYLWTEQLHGDVSITLTGPGGTVLANLSRHPAPGIEDMPWIAGEAGIFTAVIGATRPSGYKLTLSLREPSDADRARLNAFKLSWVQAEALTKDPTRANLLRLISAHEEAAAAWRKAGDRRWEGYAIEQMAMASEMTSQSPQARKLLEQALVLRRSEPTELSGLSATLNGLATVLLGMGEPKATIPLYLESLAIRREAGDRRTEGNTLANIAIAYSRTGDLPLAIEYFEQSLALRRELKDNRGEVTSLNGLGLAHYQSGNVQQAIERHTQAYQLSSAAGNKAGQTSAAGGLANCYVTLGEGEKAREYFRQMSVLGDEAGDMGSVAKAQDGLGTVAARKGQFDEALVYHNRALELRRKTHSRFGEANALISICEALLGARRLDAARQTADQAIGLARGIEGYPYLDGALACAGNVALASGQAPEAAIRFAEAAQLSRGRKANDQLARSLANLARAEAAMGNPTAALGRLDEASAISETARSQINDPDLRATFNATRATWLHLRLEILSRLHTASPTLGFDVKAFEAAEGARAHSLTELLSGRRIEPAPERLGREQVAAKRISQIQRELFQPGIAAIRKSELEGQLSSAERDAALLKSDRVFVEPASEALPLRRIQREVIRPDSAFLAYTLGDTESYAWAITATGLATAILPGRKVIESEVHAYRKELGQRVTALTAGPALARLGEISRRLYRMLVEPVEKTIGASKSLTISPDGVLAYLPFETLLGSSRMIERYAIAYAPSASALAALTARGVRRAAPTKTLLAFGDATYSGKKTAAGAERGFDFVQLPHTRAEVIGIQALFKGGTQAYLGADAKEKAVKSESLGEYRFIHFATHGYFDEEHPARSGIVLSADAAGEDGVLQAPEIMRLKLNADIVTLSACQTGLGRILAGEGVMGLSRAFLAAGAQSVVVSLWNVNDSAASELMNGFYRGLNRGLARDEALRQAKLALMKGSSAAWRHPYFWAPFVLAGDPGKAGK